MTNKTNSSIFESSVEAVEARNEKHMLVAGLGLAGGVALTGLSSRTSKTATVVTAAYAAARGYIIYNGLEEQKEVDIRREDRSPGSTALSNGELASIGIGNLIDVTAIGFIANLLIGGTSES